MSQCPCYGRGLSKSITPCVFSLNRRSASYPVHWHPLSPMKFRALVHTLKGMLKSVSVMGLVLFGCLFWFGFVIACLCSSLLSSMGLPRYGVPDRSYFIKQHTDFVEFPTRVLYSALNLMCKLTNWILWWYGMLEIAFLVVRVADSTQICQRTAVYVLL